MSNFPLPFFKKDKLPEPRSLKSKYNKIGYIFIIPAMIWLLIFNIFPMIYGLIISLFDYNPLSIPEFSGITNYINIFQDPIFISSLFGTAFYVFGTVVPVWFFSLGLALLLAQGLKLNGLWKVLLFIPCVIPTVSIALMWIPMFNENGVINNLLNFFNLPTASWLNSARAAPWAMIIMSWWQATSYYIFIFLAGILAIPKVYYEAAKMDGAGVLGRLWYLTIPLLKRSIALVVVMSIINALQTFIFQSVVTQGGPGTSTEIITLLIYRTGFEYQDMGRAAAMSVVLFMITLFFSIFQLKLFREE